MLKGRILQRERTPLIFTGVLKGWAFVKSWEMWDMLVMWKLLRHISPLSHIVLGEMDSFMLPHRERYISKYVGSGDKDKTSLHGPLNNQT
jgi:hypothetical protein